MSDTATDEKAPDGAETGEGAGDDTPEDEGRTPAEHEAARADDDVAASSFRDGDADSIIAGLESEIEGYEARIERPGTSAEMKKTLQGRIKQCKESIEYYSG